MSDESSESENEQLEGGNIKGVDQVIPLYILLDSYTPVSVPYALVYYAIDTCDAMSYEILLSITML